KPDRSRRLQPSTDPQPFSSARCSSLSGLCGGFCWNEAYSSHWQLVARCRFYPSIAASLCHPGADAARDPTTALRSTARPTTAHHKNNIARNEVDSYTKKWIRDLSAFFIFSADPGADASDRNHEVAVNSR